MGLQMKRHHTRFLLAALLSVFVGRVALSWHWPLLADIAFYVGYVCMAIYVGYGFWRFFRNK